MGIDQKLLNKSLFITLCLCLLFLSGNTMRLFASSAVSVETNTTLHLSKQLDLWEKVEEGIYVLYPFTYTGFNSLKQYLTYKNDKKLISFEVVNGRAKVVFDES